MLGAGKNELNHVFGRLLSELSYNLTTNQGFLLDGARRYTQCFRQYRHYRA